MTLVLSLLGFLFGFLFGLVSYYSLNIQSQVVIVVRMHFLNAEGFKTDCILGIFAHAGNPIASIAKKQCILGEVMQFLWISSQ
jgi:hypothetical protein